MTIRRTWLRLLAGPLAIVTAYAVLLAIASRTDLVSRILAPGGDGATAAIALGASLLVLRLVVLFVLPGVVLSRIGVWLAAHAARPLRQVPPPRKSGTG